MNQLQHSRWRQNRFEEASELITGTARVNNIRPEKTSLQEKFNFIELQFRKRYEFFTTRMSKLDLFRDLITQRLTTAALEIFAAAEKSFAELEEEISRSKEESARLQRLLDIVIQPEIKIHRAGSI